MATLYDGQQNGDLPMVKFLVEQGADIYYLDNLVFQWAKHNEQQHIVEYLIKQGPPFYSRKLQQAKIININI